MIFRPRLARTTLLLTGLTVPTLLLGVFCLAQDAKPAKPPKKELAVTKFKNIKVLKELPADDLLPLMHKWNTDLGAKCETCHMPDGFEKDDKPMKKIAREMTVMTADMNKRYKTTKKMVNCFMCHRGRLFPQTEPEKEEEKK